MARSPAAITGGVVGARGIGAVHLRELAHAGVGRLLICSRTATQTDADAHAARLGRPVVAASSVEALAEACDFVTICSPNFLHLEHAEACLARGCHVLVEKPLFWVDGTTREKIDVACEAIFERGGGRLAVNYPSARFAEAFMSACGHPGTIREFVFRYQTRGQYHGDAIAVDLLPHAFSLLLEFSPEGPVSVRDLYRGDNAWWAVIDVGATRCRFEFLQDSTAEGSELSFAVDGQVARRIQKVQGDGYAVFLDVPGASAKPVPMENPMTSTILDALSTCLEETSYQDEPARSRSIMRLIASSLLK